MGDQSRLSSERYGHGQYAGPEGYHGYAIIMGIDSGQYGPSTRAAHLQYGINATYDLSGALGIPEEYGSISITGFIYFSDAIFGEVLNDEFWGGVTFAYAW